MVNSETPARIEPCHLHAYPSVLADVLQEIGTTAAVLGRRLHPLAATSLSELVAIMNCYYSNLIEGHNTRPRDIERALADQLESEGDRRDLQLEARAHVRVQREIDRRHRDGELGEPASLEFLRWVHRSFYEGAPQRSLWIDGEPGFEMTPGELRSDPRHDVAVGRHMPPSSAYVEPFMAYFEDRYRFEPLGPAARVVATAIAHHRLNYIHPFPDGNGRVSRLMSHAMSLAAGIGAHGLWSIARGLARGLSDRGEYKRMMDRADTPRQGDLDGRGNLSQAALIEYVEWFCRVTLDQLRFMTGLFEFDALAERLERYVLDRLGATGDAVRIVLEVFRLGEITRGEAVRMTGRSERSGRDQLRLLTEAGLLASSTPKGPISLRFSANSAEDLFPRLFPAQAGSLDPR